MRGDLRGRWLAFNLVGAAGFALQVAALMALIALRVHYLWATAIAVEAAVLHNFVWHERFTWKDRRRGGWRAALRRLAGFHLLNGVISLGGNLVLMRLLAGTMGWDPVAANVAAIMVCSLGNFAASEKWVFRAALPAALVLLTSGAPAAAAGAGEGTPRGTAGGGTMDVELRAPTLEAWQRYEALVNARYESAGPSSTPFFALDAFGARGWREDAMRGVVAVSQIAGPAPGSAAMSVPDGRIHHWAGAIFVPGTTIAALLDRLSRLAGGEAGHYDDVVASRLVGRQGDDYRIYMKLRRTKVITVTYNTEHLVQYRRLGSHRAGGRSVSTRIAEIAGAGTPAEREKPVGQDGGYLWRLNAYWRYEAVNGGVLIECESLSLSRSVPMLLRPFISSVADGLARDSLERTLAGLRRMLA
jgi:putative flippase GtrA